MAYTTIDNPELFFQNKLYTGNATDDTAITLDGDENMQPDWVWIKDRTNGNHHRIYDSVRGATKVIYSSLTNAEGTASTGLKSFDSDGFTLGTGSDENGNSANLVAWNWKAGTSFSNDASATGIGTIDSSGSVNNNAGLSIVSYTGTGSAGTIKHGLGSTPAFMMIKNRGAAQGWCIYHHKNTSAPETEFLSINSDDATVDASDRWNDTAPTSSVFSVANHADTNASSANYIGYFFNEVKGYSKFGGFTGNGNADGTFVYTGFRPAWVMLKRTDSTSSWYMQDNKRQTFNVLNTPLYADTADAEGASSDRLLDILSNGFKLRGSSTAINASGGTYIYMAFAESPFTNSSGVPNNAR